MSASGKEMDWAQMACHRCLMYLGDLCKNLNFFCSGLRDRRKPLRLSEPPCTRWESSGAALAAVTLSSCRTTFPSFRYSSASQRGAVNTEDEL